MVNKDFVEKCKNFSEFLDFMVDMSEERDYTLECELEDCEDIVYGLSTGEFTDSDVHRIKRYMENWDFDNILLENEQ